MRRIALALIAIGCGSTSTPAPSVVGSPPSPRPAVAAAPEPAPAPIAPPVAAEPACDPDGFALECRCDDGDTGACLQLAEAELRHGDHDVAVARAIGLCQNGLAQACFFAGKVMTQRRLETRFGMTAAELRAKGVGMFEAKCDANDGDACLGYGRLLLQGKYVAADPKRGGQLVEKACTNKHARACVLLGNMYATGEGVTKDRARAVALLEAGCTAGVAPGCTALGELVATKDKARALALYAQACGGDDAIGCARTAADADKTGDRARATELFAKACELEHTDSCVTAGTLLADPARARPMFVRACEADIAAGCAALAPLVATGQGGPRSFGEGIELAEKSCSLAPPPKRGAKQATTCALAEKIRRSPPAIECATEQACEPLCEEKIPAACATIARLLVAADPIDGCVRAHSELERACSVGDAASCLLRGNSSDRDQAMVWYEEGCIRNDRTACMLHDRLVVELATGTKRKQALAALRAACRARRPDACTWYGDAIVDDKPREAERLWQAACDGGDARACRIFGLHVSASSPTFGIGDGSPQPLDQKVVARTLALLERGCTFGDTRACAAALRERGQDADGLARPPCDKTIAWE